MKKSYKYILPSLLICLASCNTDFENPIDENAEVEEQSSGDADFSTFIALGDSLTAGFSDGALFIDGQNHSFANILATQMQAAGGGEFTTPLMDDNFGGFSGLEDTFGTRLVFDAQNLSTLRYNDNVAANDITAVLSGSFNNLGVPGAKSFHLGFEGYGQLNPYFGRFNTSTTTSVILDALTLTPTFFSLWIGANDVLSYATSGGSGTDQTGNFDPTTYGDNDITDPTVFAQTYEGLVQALITSGSSGILTNIPSVSALPFFTTVPYNPITFSDSTEDTEIVNALNTEYGAYNAGLVLAQQGLAQIGVTLTDEEIAARSISFETNASNAVVILDESLTDIASYADLDPAFAGFAALPQIRQATADDLLVLTSSAIIGTAVDSTDPDSGVYGVSTPLTDEWVLTTDEQEAIDTATIAYNTTIETIAETYNLATYDAYTRLGVLSEDGIEVNDATITSDFASGGFFSLDGIHLTPKANGMVANEMIEEINTHYSSTLQTVSTRNLPTIYLASDVE